MADGGQPIGTPGTAFHDPRFGNVRISAVPLAPENVALAYPYDVTAGTRSGDLTLNSLASFQAGSGSGYDLYSVSLHEAGHIFGLDGNSDETSAMYQIADRIRTGPNSSDIKAIQALYGPRLADAFEGSNGNSSLATAAQLQPLNGAEFITISADLTTVNDTDVYSFKADKLEGGALLATIRTSGHSLVIPSLEILDSTGAVLVSEVGTRPGISDFQLQLPNLVEGDAYYARVRSTDLTFAIGGYRLELRPENADPGHHDLDDGEEGSDDSPETSDPLDRLPAQVGTKQNFFVASSLSTYSDVDFYRVRAGTVFGNSGGVLTVSVVATGAGVIDPVIEVFDRNQVRQTLTALVHDGGEFNAQLAKTEADRDYYVAVRHGTCSTELAGNYSLGIDFGGPLAELASVAGGTLSAPAPAILSRIEVPASQVIHLVLTVEPTSTPSAVRMSIFDTGHQLIDTRIADSGVSSSFNVYLPTGTYQFLVGGGATGSEVMPEVHYTVLGGSISDPIGPQAVPANTRPHRLRRPP